MPKVTTQYPKPFQIMMSNEQFRQVQKWVKEEGNNRSALGRMVFKKALEEREKQMEKRKNKSV